MTETMRHIEPLPKKEYEQRLNRIPAHTPPPSPDTYPRAVSIDIVSNPRCSDHISSDIKDSGG